MKLAIRIKFWIVLFPIIVRHGCGKWYVFRGAPDWLVEMAAARSKPLKNQACVSLWNEAAKERDRRKLQRG